jgi:hypothetical protein
MEILLKKEHIEDVDLENNLVSFYYVDNGITLNILVSVNGVGDITYYKDNDPLMYGEYVYSTARESLSYWLDCVFDEYGEAVPKDKYTITIENEDDVSDYIESVLERQ